MSDTKFKRLGYFLICVLIFTKCIPVPSLFGIQQAAENPNAQARCQTVELEKSTLFSAKLFNSGLPVSGQWRDGFDIADMDGDGRLDLLFGPARKGRPVPNIFLGDGNARFEHWETVHFPPLPYDYGDIKAGDLNRDGLADLVLASHLRGIVAMIQEARGYFAPWSEGLSYHAPGEFPDQQTFTSRSIALADWNRDGALDILAMNEGPSRFSTDPRSQEALGLYLNRDGYWERAVPRQVFNSFGDAIAVGTVDEDDWPDAVLDAQFAGARLLLQLGRGVSYQPTEIKALPVDAAVTAVALKDLDQDGQDEIIHATRTVAKNDFCMGLGLISLNSDRKENSTTLWRERSRDPISTLLSADLNRDGYLDIVAVRQLAGVLIFAGGKDGFRRDLEISHPALLHGCQAFDAHLANLDVDSDPELIISYAGDRSGMDIMPCKTGGGFSALHLHHRMDSLPPLKKGD